MTEINLKEICDKITGLKSSRTIDLVLQTCCDYHTNDNLNLELINEVLNTDIDDLKKTRIILKIINIDIINYKNFICECITAPTSSIVKNAMNNIGE